MLRFEIHFMWDTSFQEKKLFQILIAKFKAINISRRTIRNSHRVLITFHLSLYCWKVVFMYFIIYTRTSIQIFMYSAIPYSATEGDTFKLLTYDIYFLVGLGNGLFIDMC